MEIKCRKCGKTITVGNTNGLPNGVGFQLEDGTILNVCQSCLMEVGAMSDEDREKWFADFVEDKDEDKTEKCWQTGVFNSECDCEECSHKNECSGYEGGED